MHATTTFSVFSPFIFHVETYIRLQLHYFNKNIVIIDTKPRKQKMANAAYKLTVNRDYIDGKTKRLYICSDFKLN